MRLFLFTIKITETHGSYNNPIAQSSRPPQFITLRALIASTKAHTHTHTAEYNSSLLKPEMFAEHLAAERMMRYRAISLAREQRNEARGLSPAARRLERLRMQLPSWQSARKGLLLSDLAHRRMCKSCQLKAAGERATGRLATCGGLLVSVVYSVTLRDLPDPLPLMTGRSDRPSRRCDIDHLQKPHAAAALARPPAAPLRQRAKAESGVELIYAVCNASGLTREQRAIFLSRRTFAPLGESRLRIESSLSLYLTLLSPYPEDFLY